MFLLHTTQNHQILLESAPTVNTASRIPTIWTQLRIPLGHVYSLKYMVIACPSRGGELMIPRLEISVSSDKLGHVLINSKNII